MRSNRQLFRFLAILIAIAMLPAILQAEASAAPETNGSFIVELWDGGAYRQAASFSCDEFQKEFKAKIGSVSDPQIRIRKAAEGLAFLDNVLLDDCAARATKLQKADFDVQEITAEGLVLHFSGSFEGHLSFTGRIEPKIIDGAPFMFPQANTYIEDPHDFEDFLIYELGSNFRVVQVDGKYENQGDAFISRYLVPASGHPDGQAYIYVSNDDEYLYASADFTSDNTFDYGDDFFKVFAKIGGDVKEFKQSSDGEEYGAAAMQYTDKAEYEHMYYEVKIPLDQLGSANKLQLAFSLYGTAYTAGVISIPAGLSFTAGQTADGILRVSLNGGNLTGIFDTSP